ncbi:MerR family transcriptional regulator [Gymnodinialimonas sp. 57CJ19]|uniref:MerR family transcriptional regulator n=1 Tax=Gymnodinialimonas sp. 57CJ19 TaxID=3138498 RepID=UPI003134414A
MAKSAQAFRTIREVADWLDVAAHVLRFWESKFPQIKPVKRAGGRRYYRPADMELVGGIKVLLHDRGLTIRGVQKMISEEGLPAVMALSPSVDTFVSDGDVVEQSPSDAWVEDANAEANTPAETAPEAPAPEERVAAEVAAPPQDEAPTPDDEPAPSEEPAQDDGPPSSEEPAQEASTQEDPAAEEDPAREVAGPEIIDFPQQTPANSPAPSDISGATAAPTHDTPAPAASAAVPQSDRAEGTLGTLASLSRLSPAQVARITPQIAALSQLRDRMARPPGAR